MRLGCTLCLAAVLAIGSISPSLACKGPKVIYSDDFKERDAGWFIQPADIESGKVAVGEGRLVVRPDPERGYTVLNMAFGLPADTDICVTARIVESAELSRSGLGLIFWAKGFDDNYLFQVTGNGNYYVTRWAERAWQSVTPTAAVRAFKQGLGEENVLRVVTKGQTVAVFMNDEQLAKFRSPTPSGIVRAGFRASSLGKEPTAVEFHDFSVTDVP
jgi:hypothetical protein